MVNICICDNEPNMKWHDSLQEINLDDKSWSWLQHPHSLTKFLARQAGHEQLIIKLLKQQWRFPLPNEQDRLEITDLNKILERKIIMTVINKPWIFARTYFTKQASDFFGHDLSSLESNSLGELINNRYPNISRGVFQFGYLEKHNSFYKDILDVIQQHNASAAYDLNRDLANNIIRGKLIIRRSMFYLNQQTILFNIDEVFLPVLINKMLNLEPA